MARTLPARDVLRDALPVKAEGQAHAALPYADLPAFMVELGERDSVWRRRWNSRS